MGVVFVARQDGLEREVALKLHLGALSGAGGDSAKEVRARERFDREAHAVARLNHPHVIQVHEFGHHRGSPFLVMDLIEGESLEELLEREGAREPGEAVDLVEPIVQAVAHAHSQGILHRDLKPANILIRKDGRPFLTDFGLAKDLSDERDRLTRSGQLLGTPYFMAPEVASGATREIDARSDVYALGAVLFQTLTGRVPFQGETLIELLNKIVTDPPPAPSAVHPGVPKELDAIVLQCLEKDPERRYADASELAIDLENWGEGRPVSASRASFGRGLRRISRSRAWLAVPLLLAIGVLGAVADRVWLAPVRAARVELAAELDWQALELRPTLYGLDPRHPLEVSTGDLRKRLDQLEQLEGVGPARHKEARAYLAAYLWLLEERKRRRRPSAGSLVAARGRPDVAVRAVVLSEGGDFVGAQRLLAEALPDTPELRATELALLARHEPVRFLRDGPSEGVLTELKAALLPVALVQHFDELLGDGLAGGQVEFSRRLAAGQGILESWGEPGAAAARAGLARVLAQRSQRYAALHELDLPVALERLDRVRASWHRVPGCPFTPEFRAALEGSLAKGLAVAELPGSSGSQAVLVFEVERCLGLFSGERREGRRIQALLQLFLATFDRSAKWSLRPRSLAALTRHGGGVLKEGGALVLRRESHEDIGRVEAKVRSSPKLTAGLVAIYPDDPFSAFLPVYQGSGLLPFEVVPRLAGPLPRLDPKLVWSLRHRAGRGILKAVREGRADRGEATKALTLLRDAMARREQSEPASAWRQFDLEWCLQSLNGDPEPARQAFLKHVESLRPLLREGTLHRGELARTLIRLALISSPKQGEPLLKAAVTLSSEMQAEAGEIRASWR